MTPTFRHRILLFLLATVMLSTRQFHFGLLTDASWAVFFLAGLYLPGWRSFALLMVGAAAIDYVATQHLGVSSYCISPAYPFLLPGYGALWLGGAWFRRHHGQLRFGNVTWLAASLFIAVSLCFVLTNGSFYWLSGRHGVTSISGWTVNFLQWYPRFLAMPLLYVGAVATATSAYAALLRGRNESVQRPVVTR